MKNFVNDVYVLRYLREWPYHGLPKMTFWETLCYVIFDNSETVVTIGFCFSVLFSAMFLNVFSWHPELSIALGIMVSTFIVAAILTITIREEIRLAKQEYPDYFNNQHVTEKK